MLVSVFGLKKEKLKKVHANPIILQKIYQLNHMTCLAEEMKDIS